MKKTNDIYDKYNLGEEDRDYLNQIINPIIDNSNFVKRMTNEFPHHGNITLGEHIIEDAVLTYLLSKKYQEKQMDYRIDLAIKIAMLHDLYTIPWQNNPDAKVKHFFNKHGFRHPVEAVINSIYWYPELFQDKVDSQIIIDGIIHHMFPLPVRVINNKNELKNIDIYNKLDKSYQEMINKSLKRKKIGPVSFSRSKYQEGRIMSKADKKVSRKQIRDFSSAKSLLTGHNRKLNNK